MHHKKFNVDWVMPQTPVEELTALQYGTEGKGGE